MTNDPNLCSTITNALAPQLLPTFTVPVKHPARYTRSILDVLSLYLKPGMRVLDPFGGVGTLNKLSYTGAQIYTGEIEYRVCEQGAGFRKLCADAQLLPFANESFDAIVTSPTYGNRMADITLDEPSSQKLYCDDQSKHKWKRNTYSSNFGFHLHDQNTGGMQWGEDYRNIHRTAYLESNRLLRRGGLMIVNISDHIRNFQRVYVSKWHYETLKECGFKYQNCRAVKTPRLTFGANSELRTACEYIFVLRKPD